jgi:hypothetical protein
VHSTNEPLSVKKEPDYELHENGPDQIENPEPPLIDHWRMAIVEDPEQVQMHCKGLLRELLPDDFSGVTTRESTVEQTAKSVACRLPMYPELDEIHATHARQDRDKTGLIPILTMPGNHYICTGFADRPPNDKGFVQEWMPEDLQDEINNVGWTLKNQRDIEWMLRRASQALSQACWLGDAIIALVARIQTAAGSLMDLPVTQAMSDSYPDEDDDQRLHLWGEFKEDLSNLGLLCVAQGDAAHVSARSTTVGTATFELLRRRHRLNLLHGPLEEHVYEAILNAPTGKGTLFTAAHCTAMKEAADRQKEADERLRYEAEAEAVAESDDPAPMMQGMPPSSVPTTVADPLPLDNGTGVLDLSASAVAVVQSSPSTAIAPTVPTAAVSVVPTTALIVSTVSASPMVVSSSAVLHPARPPPTPLRPATSTLRPLFRRMAAPAPPQTSIPSTHTPSVLSRHK